MRLDPDAISGEILLDMKMGIDEVVVGGDLTCYGVGLTRAPIHQYVIKAYPCKFKTIENGYEYTILDEHFQLIEDKYGVTFKLVRQ